MSVQYAARWASCHTPPPPHRSPVGATQTGVRRSSRRPLSRLGRNHLVLSPKAGYAQLKPISRTQVKRWLSAKTHARRRTGGNYVARSQAHEPADIADQAGNSENHSSRIPALAALTIYVKPQIKILRIGHFVGRNQPGADRTESIGALAFDPLAGAFQLKSAFGEIIDYAISGDVR